MEFWLPLEAPSKSDAIARVESKGVRVQGVPSGPDIAQAIAQSVSRAAREASASVEQGWTRVERVILWQRCGVQSDANASVGVEWTERALTRVRVATGEVLASLGTTVVAAFDSVELLDAIELARSLLEDARREGNLLKLDIGIALGDIEEPSQPPAAGQSASYRGATIDRAQLLASRGHGGEILLDEAAMAMASEVFLFGREVASGSVRGQALDLTHPYKSECRRALTHLKPAPIAGSALPIFEGLRVIAQTPLATRVIIHSASASAPLDLIDRLALSVPPSLRLRVSRKAGGLQPLGGLELALRRLWPDTNELEAAALPTGLRDKLKALLRGRGVPRAEMVKALCELLALYTKDGARPWIVLDQLLEIDPATLGVIAEATLEADTDFVLFMTLPLGAHAPAALLPKGPLHELAIPTLKMVDRRAIAEAILSLDEGSEVAQRVATLGGETALGVVEAARALVSAGDLVHRDKTFVWRTGPRGGSSAVPVEALITERALGLSPHAYRVLEALCVAPPDASRELLSQVLAHDGLEEAELTTGLSRLMDEGFVDDALSLGTADAIVRGAVRNNMPPARAAELHRFVADVLRKTQAAKGFGSAQIAYHLAEGGQEADAASALVDASRAAVDAGFSRVAMRLLATAIELDPGAETRKAASEVAQAVDAASPSSSRLSMPPAPGPNGEPAPESMPPPKMADEAIRAAIRALGSGDFEAVERWLDTAVAAGWGRAAAQRVMAMAQLAQGEVQTATLTLSRTSTPDAPAAVHARDALSWALIRLQAGEAALAVRDALEALAISRRLDDANGRAAALHVLSYCFRLLARDADAARISAAAHAVKS